LIIPITVHGLNIAIHSCDRPPLTAAERSVRYCKSKISCAPKPSSLDVVDMTRAHPVDQTLVQINRYCTRDIDLRPFTTAHLQYSNGKATQGEKHTQPSPMTCLSTVIVMRSDLPGMYVCVSCLVKERKGEKQKGQVLRPYLEQPVHTYHHTLRMSL
jgi:hypothetical protein